MLGRLWKKKVEPPTKEQIRQAKKLGIQNPDQMSKASLKILIEKAQKKE
jgi:hypothetical protein